MAQNDNDNGSPKKPSQSKVGPGNPPLEYRWEKGCPSPNPHGRPRKIKNQGLLAKLDPMSAQFLEHNRRVIGQIDGEDVTNYDAILRSLSKQAAKSHRAAEIYLNILKTAQEAQKAMNLDMVAEAIKHKERYSELFAKAEEAGVQPPNVFPHPDDIIIDDDMKVRIVGPMNEEGARHLRLALAAQDMFIEGGAMLAKAEGRRAEDDVARNTWSMVRGKFYRINPLIPPRLRRKFPSFEPTVVEEEDD